MTIKHIIIVVMLVMALSACNFNTDENTTPTAEGIIEEPINPIPDQLDETPTPTRTMSPSPSPLPQQVEVQLATSTPSPLPGPPTETPTPIPTLGPWEYTIQSGDTLNGILGASPYFYDPFSSNIVELVVSLNNLAGPGSIFEGQTILIPRPTQAPVSADFSITQTAGAVEGISIIGGLEINLPPNTVFGSHEVLENETIVGIVQQYGGASLELICRLNERNFSCSGCDFDIPSGGPDCNPLINIGMEVQVPYPTATITLSPSPSGNETPTPVPTYRAPNPLSPQNGSIVSAGIISLTWVSVGALQPNEAYIIEIIDLEAETSEYYVTRSTSFRLPAELIPTDGVTHTINWSVRVVTSTGIDDNGQPVYAPIGAGGIVRTFQWQSR